MPKILETLRDVCVRGAFLPLFLTLSACSRNQPPEVVHPDPSTFEVVHIMEPGSRNPIAVEIRGPEGEVLHRMDFLDEIDRGSYTFWLFRNPYVDWGFKGLKPWDPVAIPDVPALVVMEYTPPGVTAESYQWAMRIVLYEAGRFRELPHIRGMGEMFGFRDFDQSGSLEFFNSDLIRFHETDENGIPQSPHVYRFNGERYVPVMEEDVWDRVMERYWEERNAREGR
jgi:hypothetical protein